MRHIQHILYGCILGNWIMNVFSRLMPTSNAGRYAVVAMHSSREEYVLVGRCSSHSTADIATDYVEEYALCYIGILYDLTDPGDREEFSKKLYTQFVEHEDVEIIEQARAMCDAGK